MIRSAGIFIFVILVSGMRAQEVAGERSAAWSLWAVSPAPLTPAMLACVNEVQAQIADGTAAGWLEVDRLPAWVNEPSQRQVGKVAASGWVIHGFQYLVIVGPGRAAVVLRRGGVADEVRLFAREAAGAADPES